MNKDIRLAVSFKGHRKRKKLRKLVGDKADSYLLDLWLTVATDCPEGDLSDWDEEDIALSCGWEGDPKEIVESLVKTRWIDETKDGYKIHDWEEHQGWACHAKKRSKIAKAAANKRWEKKRSKSKNA